MFESRKRHHLLAAAAPLALVLFQSHAARAEEAEPEAPIVVTGYGLGPPPSASAYSQTVIARERIVASASGRIEDVLSSVAGLQQFRRSDSRSANPSAQGVTLRALGGNATSRSLVLLDGVPMADPFFGYIPLSAIAPERLASVRVTRGGGAGAFGAGAVAGTIELDSAGPGTLGLLDAEAMVNQRGETTLSGALAPELGQGFVVLSGRWDRGQGFWTTPVAQRGAASVRARFDGWSAGLRAVAPLSPEIELQARLAAFDDGRTLRFAGADSTSSGQDASLRLVGRGAWQFDLLGYLQARNFSNVVISSTTFRRTLDQRRTPSTGWGGKAELRPPLGEDLVLRVGADWRVADGGLQEEAYNAGTGALTARRRAGGRNSDVGFYLENDIKLGALVLTTGARADRWTVRDGYFVERNAAGAITVDTPITDRAGWDGSVRGGALFRASEAITLRASAYTGLRLPTLNELYRPFVVFPVTTRANAQLRNERLVGYEAGIDLALSDAARFSLTAFDNRVKHAIANVTINAARTLRERRNVDAVRARGLEAAAELRLGQVRLDGSLAWTDAWVEAEDVDGPGPIPSLGGKRPAQTPRIAASGTLAWEPAPRWRLAATLRHTGAQFEDDLETDRLPPATTFDLFAQVPLGRRAALVLRAENLFDAAVVTRNQAGSIDLGTPRTLWAGLRISIDR